MRKTSMKWVMGLLAGTLFLGVMLAWSSPSAAAGLPPRPTPGPTAVGVPASSGTPGAAIELQATQADRSWWTAVQWQDAEQNWNTVAGWQGGFDRVTEGLGTKTWWVAAPDLGKGPFRWVIYDGQGGTLLAASAGFNLPDRARTKTVTQLTVK